MQTYELLYLTPLQDKDTDRAAIREQVAKVIQAGGGSILATRDIARQRLSYPVKSNQAGEYLLVEFTAPGGAPVASMQRELRLLSGILRLMVTVKSEKARSVGAEIEAKERAQAQVDAAKAVVADRAPTPVPIGEPKTIEDLDKRLEEILGKEMV
ncbi:30S ribosomal protein S6 [Candidatus Uhrbacteria bacterium]|nr:30S ribosomal protein S6 [Candidatus Uhrbacteria bacterium]